MLIDTNILIYALNTQSPHYKDAQKFILQVQSQGVVAHQNIVEAMRVLTHPTFPASMNSIDAIESIEGITQGLRVIYPTSLTLPIFNEMTRKYALGGNAIFDGYLTATMIANGEKEIATDNTRHFIRFELVTVNNPFK